MQKSPPNGLSAPHSNDAIRYGDLTPRTREPILKKREAAVGAWRAPLLDLRPVRVSDERLDLLLVLGVDLVLVLGPEQHGGVVEGRVVEAAALTLDDSRGEYLDDVGRELADVLGDAAQEARRPQVLAHLDVDLDEDVAVRWRQVF